MCSHAINNAICQKNHESRNEISIYLVQGFIKIDRGIICLWILLKWTLNTFEMIIGSTSVQTSGCMCWRGGGDIERTGVFVWG